jgi:hypothetical protein
VIGSQDRPAFKESTRRLRESDAFLLSAWTKMANNVVLRALFAAATGDIDAPFGGGLTWGNEK